MKGTVAVISFDMKGLLVLWGCGCFSLPNDTHVTLTSGSKSEDVQEFDEFKTNKVQNSVL